jgi:acetyl esterase
MAAISARRSDRARLTGALSLDPDLEALLRAQGALGTPDLAAMPLAQALAVLRAAKPPQPPPAHETAGVEDRLIPGPEGNRIPIRIYRPPEHSETPRGVLLHYHGGGWVGGSIGNDDVRSHLTSCRAGVIVVSVDYRLAPEHRFPAGLEDAYAAFAWVARNAGAIGSDPARVGVGGSSAGGNLAASVAMLARERRGPPIRFQLLTYPICDTALTQASHRENADAPLLSSRMMGWFIEQYLPAGADAADPLVAPLRAPDLRGLPPALIITAECDPLRDEAEAYAARLSKAGVAVTCTRYDGMVHGFITRAPDLPQSRSAMAQIVGALTEYL